MKSIFDDLYYGRIAPFEKIRPKDPKYSPLWDQIYKQEGYLAEKLSAEDKKIFTDYQSNIQEAHSMETYASFSYGFRLGMSLLWEVINGEG